MLRVAARLYDRMMSGVEEGGLAEWRRTLLDPLAGRVLEIGAGTGANLDRYPEQVTELVLAEPDRHMRSQLLRRVAGSERTVEVIGSAGEDIPFLEASFDAVVATLVLCSVADQRAVLREIRRVLRPGGEFVFLEHVACASDPDTLRWQRRIEPLWRLVSGNCHLTRSTEVAISATGFVFVSIEHEGMRRAPAIVRSTIRGTAIRQ
ncbi:MAG: class I SAM-dependent methyltransferase [Acidimicrobiales bacterium]